MTDENAIQEALSNGTDAMELVRITNVADTFQRIMEAAMREIAKAAGAEGLAPIFIQALAEKRGEFEEMIAVFYVGNLTTEEIGAALKFHTSAEGRSFAAKMRTMQPSLEALGKQHLEGVLGRADELVDSVTGMARDA